MNFHEKVIKIMETVLKSEEYAPAFKELNERASEKKAHEIEQDKIL